MIAGFGGLSFAGWTGSCVRYACSSSALIWAPADLRLDFATGGGRGICAVSWVDQVALCCGFSCESASAKPNFSDCGWTVQGRLREMRLACLGGKAGSGGQSTWLRDCGVAR